MRDMLAALSEMKDLNKIAMLRSVISIAMTRVGECAEFIISYAQHGFWGEFVHCPTIDTSHGFDLGRLVRQSLSSYTADTIQRFQQAFSELEQKFTDAVSIQTLKMVSESHQAIEVLRKDLRSIEGTFVAQVDRGEHPFSTSDITPCLRIYRLTRQVTSIEESSV
jgi:hypothetical protein